VSEWVVAERVSAFFLGLFFIFVFFQSSRPCSHLFAVLTLLVDFNDPKVDTLLVRRVVLFWLD
jgi:hypothetical protein